MPYKLPTLPHTCNALEPHIDKIVNRPEVARRYVTALQ